MKITHMALALAGASMAMTAYANPQQMDPNMPGMAGMAGMQHGAKPAEAQGVGIVRAIDAAHGAITLQHQAIASIGWPAMTMTFKVASPKVLQGVKVGEKVQFTLHPAGTASTVTAIKPMGS